VTGIPGRLCGTNIDPENLDAVRIMAEKGSVGTLVTSAVGYSSPASSQHIEGIAIDRERFTHLNSPNTCPCTNVQYPLRHLEWRSVKHPTVRNSHKMMKDVQTFTLFLIVW